MAARANVGDFVRIIKGAVSLLAGETSEERGEGKPKRQRRHWIRPHILAHDYQGAHAQLMPVLREQEREVYRNFCRLSPALFDRILARIIPKIAKEETRFRPSISPSERLAITLRFLATGTLIY